MTGQPDDRLLRRSEVQALLGLSRAGIYKMMRQGKFPLPIKIGTRSVRWHRREIQAWLAGRPRATGEGAEKAG